MDKYAITKQTWNKLAAVYEEKFMELDSYNASYDKFCDLFKKNQPTLLEIGCGPGNITKYVLNKRPDFSILGTDVAPTMIEAAQKNNPSATFEVLDAREIDQLKQKFDGILCGFCLPYLAEEDCKKLLSDTYSLLNENGLGYFSTIEGKPENSGLQTGSTGDPCYVYFLSEKTLTAYFLSTGFIILDLLKIPFEKSNGDKETHLVYLIRK